MKPIILFFLIVYISTVNAQNLAVRMNSRIPESNCSAFHTSLLIQEGITNKKSNRFTFFNICGQITAGITTAAVVTAPVVYSAVLVAFSGSGKTTRSYNIGIRTLFITSFIFGTALGVDWIASIENPDNSLLKTLGYSAVGGAAGVLLLMLLASQNTTLPPEGVVLAILLPVTSSVIYTTSIADWPDNGKKEIKNTLTVNKYRYRRLVDESMLLKIKIFEIRL